MELENITDMIGKLPLIKTQSDSLKRDFGENNVANPRVDFFISGSVSNFNKIELDIGNVSDIEILTDDMFVVKISKFKG